MTLPLTLGNFLDLPPGAGVGQDAVAGSGSALLATRRSQAEMDEENFFEMY